MAPPEDILDGISAIESSLSKHTDWLKQWLNSVVLNHNTNSFKLRGIADTPLGAWYLSAGSEPFRNNPVFATLGDHLEEMVARVQAFVVAADASEPLSVDIYTDFLNNLLDLNGLVQQLQGDAWRGLTKLDPLTGIRNRHDMIVDLNNERERSRRSGQPCGISMMDLDLFKVVNDTHGHIVGDHVLRRIARLILDQLRPYDMLYRYGGEEFLICLPNTDLDTSHMVLDRLRAKIAANAMPIAQDGADIFVTASFGVTEVATDQSVGDSIHKADQALLEAKGNGRNRVVVMEAG
ncbi:diguanylate cyclase [Pseudomonadota bacterium]